LEARLARLYHWHQKVPSTFDENCGPGKHHPTCSSIFGFTNANEDDCSQTGAGPQGKPCKCYHEVPDSVAEKLLAEQAAGGEVNVFKDEAR
jgi:hypothetical protein